MAKTRILRAAPPPLPGPRRRPLRHWRAIAPDEGLLPHELEADAVAVLVGAIEWAPDAGVDFEAALRRARETVAERAGPAPG
jgi:hypothetical protein